MSLESLIIQLEAIDNASAPIQKVAESIEQLEKQGKNLKDIGSNLTDVGSKMTTRVTAPIVAGLGASAYAAIQFESAMADVNKIFGKSEVQAAGLDKQILEMSRNIPISAEGLASIAAAGGQLGVPIDQIDEFTELAAQLGTAFDMSADTAGRSIAKLQTALNLDGLDEVREVGDIFNHLSDNSAAAASEMVDVATRVGGVANTFGLASNEVGALAASFIEMAPSPEIAATGINSLLSTLQTIEGATPKAQEAMESIGISATDMAEMIATDPINAIESFLGALGEVDSMDRANIIRDIFGTGSDAALINQLSGNTGILADNLALVGDRANYAGSAMREFTSRSDTTSNQFELMKNRLKEIGINIGTALLPAINRVLDRLAPLAERFANFAAENPGIIQVGVAIAGVAAAIGPVLIIVGKAVAVIGTLASVFAKVKLAAMGFAGPLTTGLAGAKAALTGLATGAAGLGAILLGVVFAVFRIGAAFTGQSFTVQEFFNVIKNAIMEFPANIAQVPAAIGAIFGALRAIVANKIAGIRLAFARLVASARERVSAIGAAFMAIGARISAAFSLAKGFAKAGIQAIVNFLRNGAQKAVSTITDMGQRIVSAITDIIGQAKAAGRRIVTAIADGIMSGIGAVQNAAAAVGNAVRNALPGSPVAWGPLRVLNNPATGPGAKISEMIAAGISAGASAVPSAMQRLGGHALGGMPQAGISPSRGGVAGSGGGGSTFTFNFPGVSSREEAAAIGSDLEERIRRVLNDERRNEARVAY